MINLPKDEKLKPKTQPHNFFIYGKTMSGKSYFASFFPHPLVLNTDGNSEQGSAPSIQIRNIRDSNGGLKQSVIKQLDDIIVALQTQPHTYQTIIIDVIEDICVMMEQAIALEHGVKTIGDIEWGKGYGELNVVLQTFVMNLKALPMNVIFISREIDVIDDNSNVTESKPALKDKYYNIVNGNCDLVIRTQKLGPNSYYRSVIDRRSAYEPENVTNKRVLQLLESCHGMFPPKPQIKNVEKKETK